MKLWNKTSESNRDLRFFEEIIGQRNKGLNAIESKNPQRSK